MTTIPHHHALTDRWTDRQADRRLVMAIPRWA